MDKFLTICYHQILGVIYNAFEWTNFTILAVSSVLLSIGLIRASIYLVKTLASTNRLISDLARIVSKRNLVLKNSAGREKVTVNVVPDRTRRAAFSMGWFKPSIYMTSGLIDNSDQDSLDIILHHESSHCRRFDPLRAMLLNATAELLWFIPVIKHQVENSKLVSEVLADQSAINAGHERVNVAKVLVQIAGTPMTPIKETVPATSSFMDQLEFRVKSLLSPNPLKPSRIRPGIIFASILIVAAIFVSSSATFTIKADPGGDVTMIQQTFNACADNNHSSDLLASDLLARFGIVCPHCGLLTQDTSPEPAPCHTKS